MGRPKSRRILTKRGERNILIENFLKERVKMLSNLALTNKELIPLRWTTRYGKIIAMCRYGEKPTIRYTHSQKQIEQIEKEEPSIVDVIPDAVAAPYFEDANRKFWANSNKYCLYCSRQLDPSSRKHFCCTDHKKLYQAKQRQRSNELKWFKPVDINWSGPVRADTIGYELVNPNTGKLIRKLTFLEYNKYNHGYRKCQNPKCGEWFKGRIDAKFCTDRCRVANHENSRK